MERNSTRKLSLKILFLGSSLHFFGISWKTCLFKPLHLEFIFFISEPITSRHEAAIITMFSTLSRSRSYSFEKNSIKTAFLIFLMGSVFRIFGQNTSKACQQFDQHCSLKAAGNALIKNDEGCPAEKQHF